ncbi:MAG: phosphatase PAP2 family protein [Treponema sp.]|nr:phosphatase PAP2 family protein [Treponema sp.]
MKSNKLFSKKILLPLFFLLFCRPAFSLSVSYEQAFSLHPLNEGLELSFGTLLSGSALVCDKFVHLKKNNYNAADWSINDVPDLDALFARPYSKPLHIVGTGTAALVLLSPAMFAVLPQSEWLTVGTMYTETLLLANGIKEWLKLLVYRARPYMYFDGYPQDKLTEGDWNCSFPSGHSTLAFAGAAFTTMLYCQYFPDSKYKYAVAGASFGVAALTGILRMASGNHFFTDVLAGAVIGTACGIAVPYMHTKGFYENHSKNKGSVNASVMPYGINLSFNL